ncbi:MAG TPA: cupin domain-containing protein [Alphaproteobacteria bacterium]
MAALRSRTRRKPGRAKRKTRRATPKLSLRRALRNGPRVNLAVGEIIRVAQLPSYTPPGHSETTNVRLVDGRFNGRFELVLGRIEPGGIADRHSHDHAAQVIYVRAGQARVTLGNDPPQICGPETVIRIPAGVEHEVISLGPETLDLMIVYSPPLAGVR